MYICIVITGFVYLFCYNWFCVHFYCYNWFRVHMYCHNWFLVHFVLTKLVLCKFVLSKLVLHAFVLSNWFMFICTIKLVYVHLYCQNWFGVHLYWKNILKFGLLITHRQTESPLDFRAASLQLKNSTDAVKQWIIRSLDIGPSRFLILFVEKPFTLMRIKSSCVSKDRTPKNGLTVT